MTRMQGSYYIRLGVIPQSSKKKENNFDNNSENNSKNSHIEKHNKYIVLKFKEHIEIVNINYNPI